MGEPNDENDESSAEKPVDEKAVDETGADEEERDAKDEILEAFDHVKNAASILFDRAAKDPALKSVGKEAGRVVKQIGDAAEPLAKELTKEVGRLTKDVLGAVEKTRQRFDDDEEE